MNKTYLAIAIRRTIDLPLTNDEKWAMFIDSTINATMQEAWRLQNEA
jgi:hypothetical protein